MNNIKLNVCDFIMVVEEMDLLYNKYVLEHELVCISTCKHCV